MAKSTIRVRGLREFSRAATKAERKTKGVIREKLRLAAEPVRSEAQKLFDRYDEGTASGFKVRVWGRGYGVFVEQGKRKRTGRRPDYGALQMRKALLPALDKRSGDVQKQLEKGVDELCDIID